LSKHKVITISVPAIKRMFLYLLAIIVIGTTVYVGLQYKEERLLNQQAQEDIKKLSDPVESARILEEQLIEEVKLLTITSDEKPVVQKVTDSNAFKDSEEVFIQLLFDGIQNDDVIFTFKESRRMVIYRPATNQIITAVTIPAEQSLPVDSTQDNSKTDSSTEN
jgi:hypothetical protein